MKFIAAFALLALASANPDSKRVKIAPPFVPDVSTSDGSAHIVKVAEPASYKDIPAANPPFDPNVPIWRSDAVFRNPVITNTFDEYTAPQYQSPIDMGMILVPEDVMRAVAAADAMNAEPVPLFPSLMPAKVMPESEDNLAVKFVETPMEPEQFQKAPLDIVEAVRIAETPEENIQVHSIVLPEPAVPYVESEDVALKLPVESEQIIRIAPVIVETPLILPIQMQIPAMPFVEAEDGLVVKVVDSPVEAEQVKMAAPLELDAAKVMEVPFEVDQPKEFVNIAEMPALLQDGNRPYPVYNNPMLR